MAQQNPPSITHKGTATALTSGQAPVSRVRDVMAISCEDFGTGSSALHDALCTALYRQIKDKVPGYAYRRMPDLSAAPKRRGDVRLRLVVGIPANKEVGEQAAEDMTLHLEWYLADAQTPQRGPVLRVAAASQTVPGLRDAVTTLLRMTPL